MEALVELLLVVLWIILLFLVRGTNKRLEIIHNNITDNQEEMLRIQKDILSCLEKICKDANADKDEHRTMKEMPK